MANRQLSARETASILRKIPFNALLGMRVTGVHRDGITLACKIHGKLLNSAGVLHGGVSAALADAAVGVALHRHFGGTYPITTVELKINYRPAKEGHIFARSHLLRVGSTLCVGRVDIADSQRRAIGTALVTYMILGDARKPSA